MIVEHLQGVIDTSRYGIGITKFKEIRNAMGLQRTWQQNHSIESIHDSMVDLHEAYPNAGAREMISLLFHKKNLSVSRNVVISYFAAYEADLHDKWLRFGLGLHTGIEPFSDRIMWIRVWHSNHNPQLILTYYLDTIEKLGHIPMITQSDPGSENYGITNAHTMLCQMYDSSLHGTLQHWWMRTKKNVMPEIAWSQLRRRFTPGFESLLDEGVVRGWYDVDNVLQVMVFRWVFIPWLQCELDRYQDRVNNTAKRRDRNKVLPHGVPNLIYDSPEDFGAMDFKVTVDQDGIDHVRRTYIKPNHLVFDLVPQPLDQYIQHHYDDLGRPPVTRQSAWHIYLDLLHSIQLAEQLPPPIVYGDVDEDNLPLLEHQRELLCADGTYYMGGVHGGLGLDVTDHCRLDSLAEQDEPDASLLPAEQVVEEEGLFAWFSDEEADDKTYEW
ncbi:hypothetical protein DEU56DRAFT_873091 [Suillus clintonianus]|uniref:uncharacterized protein n=1 Tax=Suillus clintonianus TaxID=1904413 RepID=UPI001B8777DD|nr:uncharacterized protein DEU56DRAFT_873091 [Suillus clintonianus]KAG2125457.1 hypothetical protein DEU56DRAFT_873091 [Suillus clintonianus]